VDDPADTRDRFAPVDPRLLYEELPPFLVAGNRFGSFGFGAGLSGLLLALAPFGHALAGLLVGAAVVLGLTGFARYSRGTATNRDASVVGLAMGWVGFVVLMIQLTLSLDLPVSVYHGP
jgi:hypothetical protein